MATIQRRAKGGGATVLAAVISVTITAGSIPLHAQLARIDVPTGVFVALAGPDTDKGIPSNGNKHTTWAHNPLNGRLYSIGGDFGSPVSSYRQDQYSFSIAERWADRGNRNAGWRLEYPYCGPDGGVQPKSPDFVGWTWDSLRKVFWMVPGTMVIPVAAVCPDRTVSTSDDPKYKFRHVMTFDPAQTDLTKRWTDWGPSAAPARGEPWMAVHDPVTDTIIKFSGDSNSVADIFNVKTKTWSTVGYGPNAVGGTVRLFAALSPDFEQRVIYAVDGVAGRLMRWNMDQKTLTDLGPVPDGPVSANNTYNVWDSVNRVLLFFHSGTHRLHVYHPTTKTWETPAMVTDPAGQTPLVRHAIVFDPYQNVMAFLGQNDEDPNHDVIWLYRYGSGSGSSGPAPDAQAPTVTITSPGAGATVTGTATVVASAGDNVGVVGVQFRVDGVGVGTERTATPYSFAWDTTATTNGLHTLSAVARDAAGNVTTSSSVTVAVMNGVDTQPPTTPSGLTAAASSPTNVNLTWNSSTDNVGVTAYRVYRNGAVIASPTATSYADAGLSPETTYTYAVEALDAAGNVSLRSTAAATTPSVTGRSVEASPSNYLTVLPTLRAGDTLVLAAGTYSANGLPVSNLNGTAAQPITVTGPVSGGRAVILGSAGQDTVRLSNSSYLIIKNLEIDSRNLGGDAVNSRTSNHHITLENLYIHGCSDAQGTVGISTNQAPVWNWVIRGNTITDCGTGMYLGDSDGNQQFVAGVIENNVVYDTIGYNIEIKHQNPLPAISGLPVTTVKTIIRNNVFSKANNAATGDRARPNVLVGHSPLSGPGQDNGYEVYGNFFYQNPTGEPLFQGEGNVAVYDNLFFNSVDPAGAYAAVHIAPHNDRPREVRIFNNTIVTRDRGITITGGYSTFRQAAIGNAIFAATPLNAADQRDNITDTFANAATYLTNPFGVLGSKDLYPKVGWLVGAAIDMSGLSAYTAWDRDFNGVQRASFTMRGAYASEGVNSGWLPKLEPKPLVGTAPPPDRTVPTVAITNPEVGTTVSGTVIMAAEASDNVGVVGVQFKVDGANVGAESMTAPYSMVWNTTAVTDGSHTLTVVARDAAGNVATSAGRTIVVINGAPAPTPADLQVRALEAFVSRFYSDVLARMPESSGMAQWTSVLQANCSAAGFDVIARGFFDSVEFRTVQRHSLNGLVRKLYVVFLGREPDAAEQAAWVAVMRQARLTVALRGFAGSLEFQQMLPDRTNRAAVTTLVSRFYQDILGREPDATGLALWSDYITTTRDLEGAALGFLSSPEFEARFFTARDYITILYRVFLGRLPDAMGLDAWEMVLRDHLIQIINQGFVPSPEFQSLLSTVCGGATMTVPDIRGSYTGVQEVAFTGCQDPASRPALAALTMALTAQTGTAFSGSMSQASGTLRMNGSVAGSVGPDGGVRGSFQYTTDTRVTGAAIFMGRLSGNTLAVTVNMQDVTGDRCSATGTFTGSR